MDEAKQRRIDRGNSINLKWLRSLVVLVEMSTPGRARWPGTLTFDQVRWVILSRYLSLLLRAAYYLRITLPLSLYEGRSRGLER